MRPNLWINHPRYFGDDPATVIRRYFLTGAATGYPYPFNPRYPREILLSHALRAGPGSLALNRYGVWRHLPENFLYITLRYRVWVWGRQNMTKLYKLLPKSYRVTAKNIWHP